MSGPQFMPFYIGDYLRDTSHLSAEQHGAYLLLLMACWTQGSLPDSDEQLAAAAKLSQHKWKKFRDLFEKFFSQKSDGSWHQKRVDHERQRIETIKIARSKAGSKGAAKRKQMLSKVTNKGTSKNKLATATATAKTGTSPERLESLTRAPAREGNGEDVGKKGEEEPGGRFAPLARSRSPHPTDALKANRKELLRQKLIRFADDRLAAADRSAAIAGLCGADPEHTDQWWLDTLDQRMRAEHWSDTG